MNGHLRATLKRFVTKGIVDGLAAGGSMVVVVPSHEEKTICDELVNLTTQHYETRGKKARTLRLTHQMNWKRPQEVLREQLKIRNDPRKPTLWEMRLLAEASSFPELLIVTDLDSLGPAAQKGWADFCQLWGQYSHSNGCKKGLLVFCSGSVTLPKQDLRTKVVKFFREPVWDETVYPDLCGSDNTLFAKVSASNDLAETELYSTLRQYGVEQGWSRQSLEAMGAGLFARIGHSEQVRDRYLRNGLREISTALGGIGGTIWHPVYGLELHPAAAALLEQYQVIERRVWRGQVSVLFPLLDAVRRDICRFMQTCQPGWHTVVSYDFLDTTYADPTSDFGHIARTCEQMRDGRLKAISQPISDLGELRNKLAHYRPLAVPLFYRVGELLSEIDLTLYDGELRYLHQQYAPSPALHVAASEGGPH